MTAMRQQRLILVLLIVLGVGIAAAFMLRAFQENMMFFYGPKEIKAGQAPLDREFRVGGLVVNGSVERGESLQVKFALTDWTETVQVHYEGILPDLFREGQGIIARGRLLANGTVQAVEVLAKHDENYMPPEVAASLPHTSKPTGQGQ
ncbi:MAG: cytochrome c maturation protein CcmE [Thiofilum sp.]|uniref:cytochrome c maturation protein CcmE n=1 Tax=Thiofilum sp. TaxID=2212733 RepID=UPI0025E487CC|nr:cytochrome c maturation protein CcmE [Thiofilum sp.]MBK8453264.1 cytochrome c maturation protein CcmE [Thiofilum sp.]